MHPLDKIYLKYSFCEIKKMNKIYQIQLGLLGQCFNVRTQNHFQNEAIRDYWFLKCQLSYNVWKSSAA